MLLDYTIPKPPTLIGYQLHQLVKGLTKEETPLFTDMGNRLIVRSEKHISEEGQQTRPINDGEIMGFELRACVSKKLKGKHIYYPLSNWRVRHEWLAKKGEQFGFQPLTINCHATRANINDGKRRKFSIDQTDFVGILKITNAETFKLALEKGIGSTAKAFGFGMLII